MIPTFENLNRLIKLETTKALRETLGGHLGDNDGNQQSERRRQKQQAKSISNRGLAKDVAEVDEEPVDEAEEESTGVPEDVDDADAPREDRTGGKGTKDSPKLKTPSRNKLQKVTIGSVIDKLNALRGGRSLKDQDVQKSFNQYFESLTDKEKQSMLVFLTGIAQILAGTKKGTEVIDPGDVGLRVKGDVVKSKKATPVRQDQESAVPIVVGENIINARMKKAIKAYKKSQSLI